MKLANFPEIIYLTSKTSDGNMSFLRGNPAETLKNRQRFLKQQNLSLNSVVVMSPMHGTKIIQINQSYLGQGATNIESALKVDALITDEANITLFLLTADCLPIALYDPSNKAVGLVHAGWKGLDGEIISKTISKMQTEFNSNPKDLIVYIGPSIGPCCYKNSPTFKQRPDPKWQPFILRENGNFNLDLWSFAENQLKEAGVLSENIENSKVCTYHSGEYFSHREADDKKLSHDYRFATVLGIKN